jgi:hypothetical protein
MTWLDLYNFLHQKANDVSNLDSELWNATVMVHNVETDDEYPCDVWKISDNNGRWRQVIVINYEEYENQDHE